MGESRFVEENQEDFKRKIIFLSILATIIVAIIITAYFIFLDTGLSFGEIGEFRDRLLAATANMPILALAGVAALAGLFFLPIPIEAIFGVAVQAGKSAPLTAISLMVGFAIGSSVSYIIGRTLSKYAKMLVSAKKMYSLRRKVNRFGAAAILVINTIPSPSPLLTFSLGITKYNYKRLIALLIAGNTIKFTVLTLSLGAF